MEGVEPLLAMLIGFPVLAVSILGTTKYIEHEHPEVNMGVVAFGSGILLFLLVVILPIFMIWIKGKILVALMVCIINIFVGWLITRTKTLYVIQNLICVGVNLPPGHRPPFKYFQFHKFDTPMEIKAKKAYHGLFSSLLTSIILAAFYVIKSVSEETNYTVIILTSITAVVGFSFCGWIGSSMPTRRFIKDTMNK